MSKDISDLLSQWEYNPENSIRVVTAKDGRQVLQVRLPLGIEQYELDGRPDGEKPFGKDTVLDEIHDRLEVFITNNDEDGGFTIDHDSFALLQNEGLLYYYRYILLFQMGDYQRTARDTEHNLEVCSLVERYCTNKDDQKSLLQYQPYILRVNALSKSAVCLAENQKLQAINILESAIEDIRSIYEVDTPVFHFERLRSQKHLTSALEQLKEEKMSKKEKLEEELKVAIDNENYELAMELRDKIGHLKGAAEE